MSRPWTKEDDALASAMKVSGASPMEMADALRRSRPSVKSRLRYLSLSPERRKLESIARHAEPRSEERKNPRQRVTPSDIRFVPIEVLKDRERRLLAPQPAFGDPPIGFSALDRREVRA